MTMAIGDTAMSAVEYAMRGLTARADVRANNIANVNTPGFRAARVDFESTLAGALRSARSRSGGVDRGLGRVADPATQVDPSLPGANGNTVSLENEMVGMLKDNLLRDAMVNAFNAQAGLMRTAMGRG